MFTIGYGLYIIIIMYSDDIFETTLAKPVVVPNSVHRSSTADIPDDEREYKKSNLLFIIGISSLNGGARWRR